MEVLNGESNRGYWDLVWNDPGGPGIFDVIKGTEFRVAQEDEDQVEVSFTRSWNGSLEGTKLVPLNIDKRFVMLRACSGFYTYAIYEHMEGWPDFNLGETRVAFKLRKDKFQYMAITSDRQRIMPMPEDRLPGRCQQLAYPEAVDDKYQYSCNNEDNKVHGWVSSDPPIGFWQITPSDEFRTGGPFKQNLTSHVGPTTLAVFVSAHYAGDDLVPKFRNGEHWKKVFGPIFIYLNSTERGADDSHRSILWQDAEKQMRTEVESWPYEFPNSEDLPKADRRGSVSGRLLVRDRYVSEGDLPADSAYVGLAPPGAPGSWQRESKGYQFWTRADPDGFFRITNIRAGEYCLNAWVPGFIGDYQREAAVTIATGCEIDLGELVYEPPRDGPTLWQIGVPDRSAAFYVPDPNPNYVNKLYANHPDRFRQYGLWERYAECYPKEDLVYTVSACDYRKDWFFAQVTRHNVAGQVQAGLRRPRGSYTLRIALASAALAELQVRFNDPTARPPHFSTGLIGRDNSIARHGAHGLYWLFNVPVQSGWLLAGDNTLFLTQPRCASPFQGLMYDYLRFEGDPACP
ncbi:unnamed protein product [Spirodela intermedia]|uniref:rhamnogalacturonan endolyase n=1 Tax=Spirodela intermedia TaxID=51605 RepID=A0A7I8IYP2_SPIIN|nr:unnamed protein product [Spirodela intermedia]CAA6663094.1 unnamed protein product [Spirodela intermedia]